MKSRNHHEKLDSEITFQMRLRELLIRIRPVASWGWGNRWKLITVNSIVAALAIVYLLLFAKPYFDSSVTILPEYGSKATTFSQLSDLAALAGVNVGETTPTEIYQNLINSEAVLGPVIESKYKTERYRDSVTLLQYFEIQPNESLPVEKRARAQFLEYYNAFSKATITTDWDRISKILTVGIRMPESALSADVANRVVESLDSYIRTKRKSYASNQRYYLEKRVDEVKDSLWVAEEALKDFGMKNRVTNQSPELLLKQTRLARTVDILQIVYGELTKQLELAKIDEIKDTPVLNIKELASDPVIKTGPIRKLLFFSIIAFSIILSLGYVVYEKDLKDILKHLTEDWKSARFPNEPPIA